MKSNTNKIGNQHNTEGGVQPDESDIYMSRRHKNIQTPLSDTTSSVRSKGPVATSTKQMAGYFTKLGIENEISRPEKDWPRFALKEVSDNAYDWLNDYYTNTIPVNNSRTRRYIGIRIHIDQLPNDPDLTRIFRVAVRNSNADQIDVFTEGLEQIFDYTQWLSTKRYQHRMTAGSLGDYLKRHAGMAYASWNNIIRNSANFNNEVDDNIQWEEPLIFRFNGNEYRVYIYYDRYIGIPESVIKYAGKSDAIDYTEVECTLPVSRINCNTDPPLFERLYQYYNEYKFFKTDIKFSLHMRYDMRHVTEKDE